MENGEIDNLRITCWDTALHCFGYSYLFKHRYRRYRFWLRVLLFVGLATPLTVGGLAISFGLKPWVITIASIIGILQTILSLWAVVHKLDDATVYSNKSGTENDSMAKGYRALGENPPSQKTKFKHEYELLEMRRSIIASSDIEQGITPKELRMAHRAGLREFQRECVACKCVPTDMKSTDCGVCGRFGFRDKDHT
jgi:mobilome CxxCx(11)CxxC protein